MSEELKPTDGITVLPDGSAFATASWPLPKDHWLYAPRGEWDNVRDDFAETPLPILTNAQLDAVIAAGRYAVRGATMCGQEQDFDPDALVQNLCYALCGPANATLLPCDAPAQPEPAAPTPDTFMGEPVLTRWKPLNRDDSRLALHQSMHNRSFGNPSDDKLMLEWLWENGYALCKRVPDEVLNRRRAPAQPEPSNKNTGHGHVRPRPDGVRARCGGPVVCKECSREKAAMSQPEPAAPTEPAPGWCKHCRQYTIEEPLQAAPTDATLDQMAGKAWDRFQRHTAELQALENCRLYAARHRKEDWAATILRFCADGGATGSPLREAAPTVVESNPWKEAVIDRLVVNWAYRKEHETNPRKALSDLIRQECEMTLDPAISSEAQALIDRGRAEAVAPAVEPEPVAHTEQWWLHRIDMEKTAAWQQGYAQGLNRAAPPRTPLMDSDLDKIIAEQWGTHPGVIFKAHRAFARAVIAADRGEKQ